MFLNGDYVSVLNAGKGEDVLLLHGYLSCKESFYYQIKFLSQYFKVTAPDMPGFGASSPITEAYSVGNYAEWLEKFISARAIDNPRIIAHSFGARVIFKYLANRNGGCCRLVITGGAGLVKPRSPQYMRRVKAYRRVKKFFPKYAEKHYGSSEYKKLSPVMRESYKKIVNEDLKDCASKIACPTLLVYGAEDSVTPPAEEGKIFNSLISGSKLEVTEGGHFCFSEHPQKFNSLIYEFLK